MIAAARSGVFSGQRGLHVLMELLVFVSLLYHMLTNVSDATSGAELDPQRLNPDEGVDLHHGNGGRLQLMRRTNRRIGMGVIGWNDGTYAESICRKECLIAAGLVPINLSQFPGWITE